MVSLLTMCSSFVFLSVYWQSSRYYRHWPDSDGEWKLQSSLCSTGQCPDVVWAGRGHSVQTCSRATTSHQKHVVGETEGWPRCLIVHPYNCLSNIHLLFFIQCIVEDDRRGIYWCSHVCLWGACMCVCTYACDYMHFLTQEEERMQNVK